MNEAKSFELNFCYHCMQRLDAGVTTCPLCGHDNADVYTAPDILHAGVILNGKYLVGRMLGRGGFGITYIGFDLALRVKVGIKEYFPVGVGIREPNSSRVLSATSFSSSGGFEKGRDEFQSEAVTLARFNSPNIVHVRDYFLENGTAYIVMDYIDGNNLTKEVEENGGKVPYERVLSLFKPLIPELGKIHEEHLIHRDIKPDNIKIVQNKKTERLVLLDFGAARSFVSAEVTHTYEALVTPGYAPIEQYSAKSRQGPYTDVYAVCATMYAMITGEIPGNATDRMMGIVGLKSFSEFGLSIPETVEKAIVHGLAIRSDDRPQTMKELYDELYPPAYPPPPPTPPQPPSPPPTPPTPPPPKRKIWPFIIAAALIVCGVVWFMFFRSSEEPAKNPTPSISVASTEPGEVNISVSTSTPIPRATHTSTSTSTPVPSATHTSTSTSTPVPSATHTPTSPSPLVPSATQTSTSTSTPVPSATHTSTSTSTPVPSATQTSSSTSTPVPSATHTSTSTSTPVPSATQTPTSTSTPIPSATNTPMPSETAVPTSTKTPVPAANTPTSTNTPIPSATNTAAPSKTPAVLTPGKLNTDVQLKSSPSVTSEVLRNISQGSQVMLVGERRNAGGKKWILVQMEDGTEGWIEESAVSTSEDTFSPADLKARDIFTFGKTEQNNDIADGPEPIEWQVLAVSSDRLLAISKYALDTLPYHEERTGVTWETSSLREWLNGEFYNSTFDYFEKEQILRITNENPDNDRYGTKGGERTRDRLFLLSVEEADLYFKSDEERICQAVPYAQARGAYASRSNGATFWWLRTPGDDETTAVSVDTAGSIYPGGDMIDSEGVAVRPALWLGF